MSDSSTELRNTDDAGHRRLATTVGVVSAYVSNNSIRAADLAYLIETIHGTLGSIAQPPIEVKDDTPQLPAVPVKKSITPDFLICLEDGKKFRSLKRHLGTVYKLSPEQYRAKWGLPRDYPMVAPAYSAVRSQLAKDIGLGRQGSAVPIAQPMPEPVALKKAVKAKRTAKTAKRAAS